MIVKTVKIFGLQVTSFPFKIHLIPLVTEQSYVICCFRNISETLTTTKHNNKGGNENIHPLHLVSLVVSSKQTDQALQLSLYSDVYSDLY